MSGHTIVLDHERVQRKLARIIHQLHEEYHAEDGIVLVGVAPRGVAIAQRLRAGLAAATDLKVDLAEIELDKDRPLERPASLSMDPEALRDRVVVLVDDVLMSGRTLMHAASFLVQVPLKRLTTVVLVDRRHRAYPIRADIVGLTLSTTLQEHISVRLGKTDTVYLS
ncbi:MAG TPA: phosphoribosyltransferase family protein [Flavobacteriales bacterium]|nr:phosphoribosyltransferase family protein [Flavobacteriales bacterium]